jgi:hypothetical protein
MRQADPGVAVDEDRPRQAEDEQQDAQQPAGPTMELIEELQNR